MKKILYYVLVVLVLFIGMEVKAAPIEVNDSYSGDYSIDYLISHYNAITLGQKSNILPNVYKQNLPGTVKGNIKNVSTIQGPILVNGNYTSSDDGTFANDANYVSYIKGTLGENLATNSKRAVKDNYIDFAKMYAQVQNESQMLYDSADAKINSFGLTINEPGIYTITNTNDNCYSNNTYDCLNYDVIRMGTLYKSYDYATSKYIYVKKITINNYDPNANYVFNFDNEIVDTSYIVLVNNSNYNNQPVNKLAYAGNFTNNIIFNYPNARYVEINFLCGTLIAPKADVFMYVASPGSTYNPDSSTQNYVKDYGTIIANSITGRNMYTGATANYSTTTKANLAYVPHTANADVLNAEGLDTIEEVEDYTDDLYSGKYTLEELLQRYNVVSFGKKEYESDSKLKTLSNDVKGSVKVFHIAGAFLVNGNLYADRTDLENNGSGESFVKGNVPNFGGSLFAYGSYPKNSLTKYWGYVSNQEKSHGSINKVYLRYNPFSSTSTNYPSVINSDVDYINMDRLYDSVIEKERAIAPGEEVTKTGLVHLKIGENYTINDISAIDEIVFDNFADNENKTTIITINNTGKINFPLMSKDTGNYLGIQTNDYFGKKEATYTYEIGNFFPDTYYGNIIWNVPNATSIKIDLDAPFAGHLIAPKADVEMSETHFSGCFIVNSLYAEGNSEAHFYPLNRTLSYKKSDLKAVIIPDTDKGELIFSGNLNNESLLEGDLVTFKATGKNRYILSGFRITDELGNKIEYEKTSNADEYSFIMPDTNVTIEAIYSLTYEFIEGMGQDHVLSDDTVLKFRINMKYDDFVDNGKIFIDEEEIDCNCYILSEGSTIITFKESCSKKLALGDHEIVATLEDGSSCKTNFTVSNVKKLDVKTEEEKKEDKQKNPATTDKIILVIVLLLIASAMIYYLHNKETREYIN